MITQGWKMAMVPEQIVLDTAVSPPAFRLFCFLSLKQGQGEKPNLTAMAAGLGTNTRVIKRWLKELGSFGYLRKEPAGKRKIDYILVASPDIDEGKRPEQVPLTEQHRAMLKALAAVCGIDLSTVGRATEGKLNQAARILREAGAIPEDLALFSSYWTEEDWRGKKGSLPIPAQVRSEWGKAMVWAEKQEKGETDLPTY